MYYLIPAIQIHVTNTFKVSIGKSHTKERLLEILQQPFLVLPYSQALPSSIPSLTKLSCWVLIPFRCFHIYWFAFVHHLVLPPIPTICYALSLNLELPALIYADSLCFELSAVFAYHSSPSGSRDLLCVRPFFICS